MQYLFKTLQTIIRMFQHAKIKIYEKGSILLHQGAPALYAYKVLKGCLKSYVLDKSGKEHIIQFAPEDWIISDMNSFINHAPSSIFIEAIENTEVLALNRQMLPELENLSAAELLQNNTALMRNLISVTKRLSLLLSATAEERYLDFLDTYPNLFQRLPLKLIASYIGITPEYLSEIRKKITYK